jgi:hypothetical protein
MRTPNRPKQGISRSGATRKATPQFAPSLYLKDNRDYSQLTERLRPPKVLELDLTDSHVLTTYAGLLLRDLLDRFDGDVEKVVGAYNGGVRDPNVEYAAGVRMVAECARNILARVAEVNEQVSTDTLEGKINTNKE